MKCLKLFTLAFSIMLEYQFSSCHLIIGGKFGKTSHARITLQICYKYILDYKNYRLGIIFLKQMPIFLLVY